MKLNNTPTLSPTQDKTVNNPNILLHSELQNLVSSADGHQDSGAAEDGGE